MDHDSWGGVPANQTLIRTMFFGQKPSTTFHPSCGKANKYIHNKEGGKREKKEKKKKGRQKKTSRVKYST